jgi:hypothetical protein
MSDSARSLREAAALHLEAEGLPADAGVNDRWVKSNIGPIPFYYPNTQGRKKLVAAHDLHHLLADYRTDIPGEAEMGAWELGSGMRDRTGVRLAIRVFGFALPLHRERLHRAFVRGRNCQNLLDRPIDAALLGRSVAELRAELGLDQPIPAASDEDRREFRVWSAKALVIVWGPLIPMGALLFWWLG